MSAVFAPDPCPAPDADFARDVLSGLAGPRKAIPPTWLYDENGSALFERITALPEYYPTRTEIGVLEGCVAEVAAQVGPGAVVIELGSGSSRKTPLLLRALRQPAAYVPIDISAQFLMASVQALARRFPALPMRPLAADFTRLETLPLIEGGQRLVFFPGSTIGNFEPEPAVALLDRIGRAAGRGALMLLGADTTQDPAVLLPAYDDAQRVTAAFDLNLLHRINRELDGDFDVSAFTHEARWDALQHRIEMHLVSRHAQQVSVLGQSFTFAAGESIHTENSYKHDSLHLQALVRRAGWRPRQRWTDGQERFAVHLLERER